jgi:hypothetical protein
MIMWLHVVTLKSYEIPSWELLVHLIYEHIKYFLSIKFLYKIQSLYSDWMQ